jgi:uncharacterized protein (DUF427 family)
MSLTIGRGPFGPDPAGRFDFDAPRQIRYDEAFPRRVRGILGGVPVVDSEGVRLVHATGSLAHYAFPAEDVHVACAPVPGLDGFVTVAWDSVDAWFEEDERILVHPRDPYHRIDVHATSRRVRVSVEGTEVACSSRVRALYETSLPTRWYFPRVDVRLDHLRESPTVTECAYKGAARHWTFVRGDRVVPDVAWSYDDVVWREGEEIRNLVAFYDERVDIEIDGVLRERPVTRWSR